MSARFISGLTPPTEQGQAALCFAFEGDKLLHREHGSQIIPNMIDFSELGLESRQQHYLGTLDKQACFAIELAKSIAVPEGMVLNNLRQAYQFLGDELFVVAGRSIQIIAWDRTHQFCGRCGTKTVDHERDRAKECPECNLMSYPRLSPSIIVRIRRGQEILLARNPNWPQGWYSVLAGFVEPGETLEQAVEREVMEEVGIRVKNIKYFGSQPWPFPNSLMLGFTADYAGGDLEIDPVEIEDAKWFTVDTLPKLSSKMSISRWLIDDFLDSLKSTDQ